MAPRELTSAEKAELLATLERVVDNVSSGKWTCGGAAQRHLTVRVDVDTEWRDVDEYPVEYGLTASAD